MRKMWAFLVPIAASIFAPIVFGIRKEDALWFDHRIISFKSGRQHL